MSIIKDKGQQLSEPQMKDVAIFFFSPDFDRAAQGLTGEGRRLADKLAGRLHAGIMGQDCDALATAVSSIADTVTIFNQEELTSYQPETYLAALTEICRDLSPRAVLLGNDTYSQELTPRLAHRLGGSAVGDAVEVRAVDDVLFASRQVYGGKAQALIELQRRPALVWLRARSFAPAPARDSTAEVTHSTLSIDVDMRTRMTER